MVSPGPVRCPRPNEPRETRGFGRDLGVFEARNVAFYNLK